MDPMVVIAVGFILLVIMAFVIITGDQRKRVNRKTQTVSTLGLRALDEAPHELTRTLNKLFQQPAHVPISYEYVYYEHDFNADVYIIEINETSNREEYWSGKEVVAILSPLLSLPQFSLTALPDIDGNPGRQNLMERMLDGVFNWAASRMGLTRLNFADQHQFHQQFALFVENEITARHFFTSQRLQSLAGFPANIQMVGSGSMMVVSLLYPPPDSGPAGSLKELYRLSKDLLHVFQHEE